MNNIMVIKEDTGEIITKEVKVSYKIPPKEMTNEQLKEYLDDLGLKFSYSIDYDNWRRQNIDIKLTSILKDIKTIGIFNILCELANGYNNSIKIQNEKDLMEIIGLKKTAYTKYMNTLKESKLIKVIKYNGYKYLVINPIYTIRGICLSAPVFLAYKEELKSHLNPYIFEYYVRIYEGGNVIPLKTYASRYIG